MASLKDVYSTLVSQDQEKLAQAQVVENYGEAFVGVDNELLKQAEDYDHIGRTLAHGVMGDLLKEAVDDEMPEAGEEEKKKKLMALMAKARGEPQGEGGKEDEEGSKEEAAEKKAYVASAVLAKMAQDPEYTQQLLAKYYGG